MNKTVFLTLAAAVAATVLTGCQSTFTAERVNDMMPYGRSDWQGNVSTTHDGTVNGTNRGNYNVEIPDGTDEAGQGGYVKYPNSYYGVPRGGDAVNRYGYPRPNYVPGQNDSAEN